MRVACLMLGLAALVAGCSPSGDQGAPDAQDEVDATSLVQFDAQTLDGPIQGFYTPDFDYHIRATHRQDQDNGSVRVRHHLEIRGISQEEAASRVQEAFIAGGYEQRGRGWDDGTYNVSYRQAGRDTVFVRVRDLADGAEFSSPDGTGYMRISWEQAPDAAQQDAPAPD